MVTIRPEVEVLAQASGDHPQWLSGTGFVLGGQLVLTASFIVTPPEGAEKILIRTRDVKTYEGQLVWSNQDPDYSAALIAITDPKWTAETDFAPIHFGQVGGEGLLNCQIVGYPAFKTYYRDGRRGKDTAQVTGVIAPLANAKSGHLSININSGLPPKSDDLRSPWQGIAGAPVQSQGYFVGMVVTEQPDNSLGAIRIEKLAQDHQFVKLVEKEIGHKLAFEPVSRIDSFGDTLSSVIESVATADVSNIQQIAALQLALNKAYYERVLSQARSSFISALISASIGLLFFLAAVSVSFISGAINTALISTISGAIVEVIAGLNFWLYSRTSAQLDAFHLRLERTQRFLLANSVSTSVQDAQQKDKVVASLVASIASSVIESKVDDGSSGANSSSHRGRGSSKGKPKVTEAV